MRAYLPDRIVWKVMEKCEFRCMYCGTPSTEGKMHIEHMRPVSKGGTDSFGNLVLACSRCNWGKHVDTVYPVECWCQSRPIGFSSKPHWSSIETLRHVTDIYTDHFLLRHWPNVPDQMKENFNAGGRVAVFGYLFKPFVERFYAVA